MSQGDLLSLTIGGDGTSDLLLDMGPLTYLKIIITPAFGQPTTIDVFTPEVFPAAGDVVIL
jgi:hypothetical protein